MRLELEFHKADLLTNATAYVVLNGVRPSPDGRPCLTFGCAPLSPHVRRIKTPSRKQNSVLAVGPERAAKASPLRKPVVVLPTPQRLPRYVKL
jgi:hypothetical protein